MKNVSFFNSKGQRLAGVLHESDQWNHGPTVIICHGFRGTKEGSGKAAVFSEEAVAKGYRVLRFDFSGTGESEGRFDEAIIEGYMDDLSAAVDYLKDEGAGPIIALGRSLGGTVSICQAAIDKRIGGVCTWGGPSDLVKTFIEPQEDYFRSVGDKDIYQFNDETGVYQLKKDFFTGLAGINVLQEVQAIAPRPVLIIHGSEDETVNMDQGIRLFEKAKYPKELAIVAGADHRFNRHFQYVFDISLKWLQKYFPTEVKHKKEVCKNM